MKNCKMLGLALVGFMISGGLLSACATKPPEAGISSSSNPREEISKMSERLDEAQAANIDVLAVDDYRKSVKAWNNAKDDMADNKDQEKVLDNVRTSRLHLNQAYATAKNRAEKAPGLFEARQNALKAGVAKHTELRSEWESVDKDVAASADDFVNLSAEKISRLQARYIELERKAMIETYLGSAKAKINGARKESAARKSPETFKKAELSLKNAENVISSNVKTPAAFREAVVQANRDAALLAEVTEVIASNGKNLSEKAALSIVAQRRQISDLKENLSESQANVEGVEGQLSAREQTLAEQRRALSAQKQAIDEKNVALGSAQSTVAMQQAIEKSRSQFSANEAEAYQQGGNLLIRLKSVNFASGRAELPAQSLPLLSKVSEVAKSLNAKEIKVEGHTDSVGTSEVNKTLSQQRASAVASYFKANGFDQIQVESEGVGFDKPIATNKSKEGRAQNRRVDIVIVPDSSKPAVE